MHIGRYMAAADHALRQMLTVQLLRPERTTKRYHARDESSLTKFTPSIFTPSPDRLTFPVLGTRGQPDVRTRRRRSRWATADPETREQEAVGWTHGNYVTGFGSSWRNFRAPVAGRYRLRFCGYTIWVGPGGRVHRFAGERDKVGKPGDPHWFRPNGDDISPGRRLRADHRLRQGRHPEPPPGRIRPHDPSRRSASWTRSGCWPTSTS